MVRELKKKDDKIIKKFYRKSYSKSHILLNDNYHNWQFKKNPFNDYHYKSILIEGDKEIISQMGLIPINVKFFNTKFKSCWHLSFMTSEKHRGQGIGTKLALSNKKNVKLFMVLGGTEGTKKIYMKNNGIDFGLLNRYICIFNQKKIEKFIGKNLKEKKIDISFDDIKFDDIKLDRIKIIPKKYEQFWNIVKKRYPITIDRTIEYLNWRFLQHPLIDYHFIIVKKQNKICGYFVIRFEKSELIVGRIVDLISIQDYDELVIKSIITYISSRCDFADFFATGNFYKETLKKYGFNENMEFKLPVVYTPIDRKRIKPMNFFVMSNDKRSIMKIRNVNNWFIVKADSDQDRAY